MAGYAEPVVPAPPDKAQEAQAAPRAVSIAGIRELGAIVGLVALADVTIYRGEGYAGLRCWSSPPRSCSCWAVRSGNCAPDTGSSA